MLSTSLLYQGTHSAYLHQCNKIRHYCYLNKIIRRYSLILGVSVTVRQQRKDCREQTFITFTNICSHQLTNLCGHHHISFISVSVRVKDVGDGRTSCLLYFNINHINFGFLNPLVGWRWSNVHLLDWENLITRIGSK